MQYKLYIINFEIFFINFYFFFIYSLIYYTILNAINSILREFFTVYFNHNKEELD